MSLDAPSASATICRARSAQTAVTAACSSAAVGVDAARAAGQQQHGVVGRHAAVGVDPVEAAAGGRAQHLVEQRGVGDGVGGDDDEHRGERRREHRGALGHPADRPAVARARRAVLATVSVVRIASAAAGPPSARQRGGGRGRRRAAAGPSAAGRRSGRSSRPRPGRRRCRAPSATASAVRWVSAKPSGPVQALAPPELSTTASTRPPATTCCGPQHRRGLDPVAGEDAGGGRAAGRR